ncbi:MAG TPA: hypothetical protein VLL08_31335 [Kineosporiaceae bacterium]|nr:hypothetical protein [Kineosporiaceae bacterium]
MTDTEQLIRRLVGGDPGAAAQISAASRLSDEPILLVAAALAVPSDREMLTRAMELASTTRDRQLIVIAAAHLDGDTERVDALARDHLVDHPDSVLVAWIAANSSHPEGTPS